ncbi:MAG: autotransporter outer membrane beta-barrel domain-containing protein [Smithellaceae bacterium]|nr:autotransporter outer membrane beta-barrel domain-containing protein [Smithellaceae bacterium]
MISREADPRWGVFAKGSLILGDQKNTADQKGYAFKNGGFTLGMDYRIAPRFVAGAMFGYNDSRSSVNDAGSKIAMEGYAASLYGSVFGDALYGDFQLSYGWNRYDNTRRIVFPGLDRTAASSPSRNQLSAYGGTGYDFRKGSWTLEPTLSLQYISLQVGEYTETGAGGIGLFGLRTGAGKQLHRSRRGNFSAMEGRCRVLPQL